MATDKFDVALPLLFAPFFLGASVQSLDIDRCGCLPFIDLWTVRAICTAINGESRLWPFRRWHISHGTAQSIQ